MANELQATINGKVSSRDTCTPWPSVEQRLFQSLLELERAGGPPGWMARKLLDAGHWVEHEVEERQEMIGGIDNMFLLMAEVVDFNPVCAATYSMKTKLSLEALEKTASRLAENFPRYKQRLTSMGRKMHGPHFEPDPDFDLKFHVHAVTLDDPAGRRELDNLMGEFIAKGWDLKHPLWEMLLVENYHDEDGAQCALMTRAHHTLADGQGFVLSQLYMTSYYDELVETMEDGARKLHAAKRGKLRPSRLNQSLRLLDPLAENRFTKPIMQVLFVFLFWSAYILSTIFSLFWSTYQGLHQFILFILTCWRIEMITGNYQGPRVKEREFSSSKVFSMKDVKLCQQAFSGTRPFGILRNLQGNSKKGRGTLAHVTLNDVVCSVMVDVLGEEIKSKRRSHVRWDRIKEVVKHVLPSPIGFFIPISVRKPGDMSMRNQSTGSMVYLNPSETLTTDVSVQELYAHIHACRSELSLLKHSVWPKLSFKLGQLTGQAPLAWPVPFALLPKLFFEPIRNVIRDWITIPMIRFTLQSFPVILTNVPGPSDTINLADVEVVKWTALPPQAGKGTIGLGVISYAGGICISVAADKVPETEGAADRICQRFEERFALYVARARQVIDYDK